MKMNRLALFLTVALLFAFHFSSPASAQKLVQPDERDFKIAQSLFNDGIYSGAILQLNTFLQKYPKSSRVPRAHFLLARSYFETKAFEKARRG